jgi:hypothetical protein
MEKANALERRLVAKGERVVALKLYMARTGTPLCEAVKAIPSDVSFAETLEAFQDVQRRLQRFCR